MINTGLVSITFRSLDPAEIIGLTADAGLDAVEWGGDIHVPHGDTVCAAAVGQMTREAGLAVSSYGSYYRAGVGEGEGANPTFAGVLDTAEALGAPLVRVWAGSRGSESAGPEYRRKVEKDLHRIAEDAAARGIKVGVEYHSNTLTDTNPSAARLLEEVPYSNLLSYWQPPNGKPAGYAEEGLRMIGERLAHLHVFHWVMDEGGIIDRRPLEEGEDLWKRYLRAAEGCGGPDERYALLEFVRDGTTAQFAQDAAVLKRLVRELTAAADA